MEVPFEVLRAAARWVGCRTGWGGFVVAWTRARMSWSFRMECQPAMPFFRAISVRTFLVRPLSCSGFMPITPPPGRHRHGNGTLGRVHAEMRVTLLSNPYPRRESDHRSAT